MAGLKIQVDTISPRTCILCRDYLSDVTPDIKVTVRNEDIEKEKRGINTTENKEIYIETISAYRKIANQAVDFGVLLMHGAVIATSGCSYMFSAPSGIGKTTHIKQWLRNDPEAFVVNGDKPMIRIMDGNVLACGTPWSGNEHMNTNTMVPLKAIILMERSDNNHIMRIPFAQAYPYLVQQTYIPKNVEKAKKALGLLLELGTKVSFFRFQCNNFRDDCFETSYTALVKKQYDEIG